MKVLGVNFFETQCKACRPRKSIVWVVLLVWFSTLDCKAAFSNKITVDRSVCTADTCFSSWASLIASQRCHQPRPKCCCSAMKCCEALYQLLLQLSAAYMTRGRDEQLCVPLTYSTRQKWEDGVKRLVCDYNISHSVRKYRTSQAVRWNTLRVSRF